MQVKELMTRDVEACSTEDRLSRAAQIMWDRDCGVVPVIDEQRRLVGVITDRDICMATHTKDLPPSSIPVSEVMTRDVESCRPDDSIADAENAMVQRHVRRVPIVDDAKRLVGILSLNDVVRQAARDKGKKRGGIAPEEFVETMASVCQPWTELEGQPSDGHSSRASKPIKGAADLMSRQDR